MALLNYEVPPPTCTQSTHCHWTDLFSSFRIDCPLVIAETKPLVERSPETALVDEPDLADFQDESEMRQWLRDYQKKKVYVRPVVVYPSSAVRDLHKIYVRDDDDAVFDFIRFRAANLTIDSGKTVWVQRQLDIAAWTKNAHMLYRVIALAETTDAQRDHRVVHALMQQQGFTLTGGENWHCLWCGEGVRLRQKQYRSMVEGQRVNRYPGTHLLTSPLMWAIFSMDLKKFHDLNVPDMFSLPEQARQLHEYRRKHSKRWIMLSKLVSRSSPRPFQRVVVQPAADLPSLKEIGVAIATHFLDKPKLVMKRQAEIVMLVSVTCFDPLRCYVYEEGMVYLREPCHWPQTEVDYGFARNTSASKKVWGIDDDDDVTPVEDSEGNIHRSWTWLKSYLRSKGHDVDGLQRDIRKQILKVIISTQSEIIRLMRKNVHRRDACCELFQFKFLLDRELRPCLLSIKQPELKCISPVQVEVISGAIADTLNMIHITPRKPIVFPRKMPRRRRPTGLGHQHRRIRTSLPHHVGMSTPSDLFLANCSSIDPLQLEMENCIFNECLVEDERKGRFVRLWPSLEYSELNQVFADPENELQQAVFRRLADKQGKAKKL